jgi:Permuted papain-like amidase enzyme, YaeF/YiiX, C92 family
MISNKKKITWQGFIFACVIMVGCLSSCKGPGAKGNTEKIPITLSIDKDRLALQEISKARAMLQDGELITRSDDDFESLTLQNFSKKERVYSHAGIVFKEGTIFMVYHCIAGIENPDGRCRKDPYDSFVNPSKKTGFGLFTYTLSDKETDSLHCIFRKNFADKIPFDIFFNLKSNDSMYCSEMIYKSLKAATRGRIVVPTSVINNFKPKIIGYKLNNVFLKKFEYIGIDDLYLNPFCKELMRVKY